MTARSSTPKINPDTLHKLLKAAETFAAAEPWALMADSDVVGLVDPVTKETRLASVLGNGGEVFGAVMYRRPAGLRWAISVLGSPESVRPEDFMDGLDALKVEFLKKNELMQHDLALLKAANFKPARRGLVWPQFQSAEPGWVPWLINELEAEQLAADLPRLTSFHTLFLKYPDLYEGRPQIEIPFLPDPLPDRALELSDLNWHPLVVVPEPLEPYMATEDQWQQLAKLARQPKAAYEFGNQILPGSTVMENGRPCFSRISMLVEKRRGLILGFDLGLATKPLHESAGSGLVAVLVQNGFLPGRIFIENPRLETVLKPICDRLDVKLVLADELPGVGAAMMSMADLMMDGR